MIEQKPGPNKTSSDYDAMAGYWDKVRAIMGGTEAMRAAGKKYLPSFPAESGTEYNYRRSQAKFTNIFRDIVENLASKPFAKPVSVDDKSISKELKDLCENIDGAGNNLHVFAAETFFKGIANAVDYILVDCTRVPEGATLADEKKLGARPYWVQIDGDKVLAAYTDMINGSEEFVHVRIFEPKIERDGFGEKTIERVRVFNREPMPTPDGAPVEYAPPTWTVWENRKDEKTGMKSWVEVDRGRLRVDKITLVPFVTGRRIGASWRWIPAMVDAADLQIEHYQKETNLKLAEETTAFPMLKGVGVTPQLDKNGKPATLKTGPRAVLYAPLDKNGNHGDWGYVEPGAESLRFLASQIEATEKQLRELGRQPLTAQSGNLTVITAAVSSAKGNSAVQMWALGLKDAIERALQYTALWMQDTISTQPVVNVYTDFGIETADGSSMDRLLDMRQNGDLDQETLLKESQRRGELSADHDIKEIMGRIAAEAPEEPTAEDLLGALAAKPQKKPPRRTVNKDAGLEIAA